VTKSRYSLTFRTHTVWTIVVFKIKLNN
jgi:hypothetical protein